MFQKALIIILVTGMLIAALFLTRKEKVLEKSESTLIITPTNSISSTPESTVHNLNGDYVASWLIVRDTDKITLHSNLNDKLTSEELIQKSLCDNLVSGGFYSTDNKHLGLFVADGNNLNNSIQSSLLNGYFYINKNGSSAIDQTVPKPEVLRLAVQSGPILIIDGKSSKIISANNENARRILVAKTLKNEIAFIAIYSKNSNLIGPTLTELPKILDDIQKTKNMKFDSALNLDGGSHSAFITKNTKLAEVSKIGSYFCIKP